jgi:hypothetical protein
MSWVHWYVVSAPGQKPHGFGTYSVHVRLQISRIQNAVIGLSFILFKVQPHSHVTPDYGLGRQHPETETGPGGLASTYEVNYFWG